MLRKLGPALLLTTAVAACAPVLPPVAAGVPGDAAFKARVATVYRPGTSGVALRADLEAQGFTVYDDASGLRHSAVYVGKSLPCDTVVRIDWTEDRRGRIARIQAQRHDCS